MIPWRRICLLALLSLPLVPAAPAGAAEGDRGRTLYENSCSSCHGVDGAGTPLGPDITGAGAAGAHFMLTTGRMPLDDPAKQPVRKAPAFDAEAVAAISRYVAGLGSGPPIPQVDLERADLVEGQQLYSANCGACHSSAGAGGAVGAGLEAPPLQEATAVQIVEAMRIGPGTMPVFEERTLTPHQADSIARYLLYLREAPDPGGLGLGRIGPIAEGFVTWLVGLGILVLCVRWIGEEH